MTDTRAPNDTTGSFVRRYLERVQEILASVDPGPIAALIEALLDTRERGGTVYVCGNGGSSATAQHLASDLLITVRTDQQPFRAVCLSDNVAALTAVANDYGYEHVFSVPLRGRIGPGDLLIAISASGNSENILNAVWTARAAGARTAGIVGFDGGALMPLVELSVHVPSKQGEYGPVEDIHAVVKHVIAARLVALLKPAAPDPDGGTPREESR